MTLTSQLNPWAAVMSLPTMPESLQELHLAHPAPRHKAVAQRTSSFPVAEHIAETLPATRQQPP